MPDDLNDLDPRLAERIRGLRDTAPERDLWQDIAPRLTPRRPKGTLLVKWPLALAAGVALVVATAAGTMAVLRHRAPATPTPVASALGSLPIASVAFTPADSALALAIRDVEARIRTGLAQLDPATRLDVERSLATLDHAIEDAALERRAAPDDPGADRFFTSTLRKKLSALRTIADLTTSRS
jgi:hypothetical protein